MKTLFWDSIDPATGKKFTWDNPNLRWGSPSVILELGDPGFVETAGTAPAKPKNKPKVMKHQVYYPIRQQDQAAWLHNFRSKLPAHAAALGLVGPALSNPVADANWLHYVLNDWLPAVRAWSLSCTTAVKEQETGTIVTAGLPAFVPPALPAGVAKRPEGVLTRIFDLVQEIKKNNACTDSMCADLGIVGAEETGPDFDTLSPNLAAKRMSDHVKLTWTWQGNARWLDQCLIQVDRGDGKGWQPLTSDTTPGSEDAHPMPATLTKWRYRAIYRVDDKQIGLWSAEIEVIVGP